MSLTTRGKVTLSIRLVALAFVLWSLVVVYQTYATAANMRRVQESIGNATAAMGGDFAKMFSVALDVRSSRRA
jgi:CHASE3 domain sensor protein